MLYIIFGILIVRVTDQTNPHFLKERKTKETRNNNNIFEILMTRKDNNIIIIKTVSQIVVLLTRKLVGSITQKLQFGLIFLLSWGIRGFDSPNYLPKPILGFQEYCSHFYSSYCIIICF